MANEKLIYADSAKLAAEYMEKHLVAGESDFLNGYLTGVKALANGLAELPAVDAVEVVRCKDCKFYTHANQRVHWNDKALACFRKARTTVQPDDFCSYGERKDNGN